jgi:hypothetical protein
MSGNSSDYTSLSARDPHYSKHLREVAANASVTVNYENTDGRVIRLPSHQATEKRSAQAMGMLPPRSADPRADRNYADSLKAANKRFHQQLSLDRGGAPVSAPAPSAAVSECKAVSDQDLAEASRFMDTARERAATKAREAAKEAARHPSNQPYKQPSKPSSKQPSCIAAASEADAAVRARVAKERARYDGTEGAAASAPSARATAAAPAVAAPPTGSKPPPYVASSDLLSSTKRDARFASIRRRAGNEKCAECAAHDTSWVVLDYGVLICTNCAGAHRGLGSHISQVRSTS